jgi:hypothetical protein
VTSKRTPAQPALRVLCPLARVATMRELFGQAYRWDGRCECGADDWQDEYWDDGYRVACRRCGRWVCYHEAGSVAHTSEGRWAPYPNNRRARPPAGCPSLTEGAAQAPEGGQDTRGLRNAADGCA